MTPSPAIVVSLCALILTFYQAWASRRHNRLSVRPYIVSRWNKRKENEGTFLSYELINVGLGPAIVKEFTVTVPGFQRQNRSIPLIEELVAHVLVPGKIRYHLKKQSFPTAGYCIVAHETYLVGEVFLPTPSSNDEQHADSILQSIDLRLRYASFYGEVFRFPEEVHRHRAEE